MNRRPWAFFRSVLHLRRTGGNGTLNKPQDGSPDSQDTSVNQDSDAVAGAGSRKHKRPVELEAAEERQAWSESPEFGKLKRAQRLILGLTPVAAFIGSLSPLIYENEFRNRGFSSILTAAVIGAGIWLYLSLYYLVFITRRRLLREFKDRRLLSDAHDALKKAEDKVKKSGTPELAELWDATNKRLDYYHTIALSQSEKSFLYGQIAAGTGFAVIIIAAFIAGASQSPTASIVAGLTGVTGGGLGAYIGATFMRSQSLASAQLRAYFLQPLELSKYLAAERLSQQIPEDKRATAIQSIIDSINAGPSYPYDRADSKG